MRAPNPSLPRRIEPHDRNQIELKLAYLIRPEATTERYHVETFIFTPATLGIDTKAYTQAQFYSDTAAFFRLKTPTVDLASLADPTKAGEWFGPLMNDTTTSETQIIRRLKLLGCIYRAALRDRRESLLQLFDKNTDGLALPAKLEVFVRNATTAIERLRTLHDRFSVETQPSPVRETWRAVDEYVSIKTEQACTYLVAALDDLQKDLAPLRSLRDRLADVAVSEYRHRRARNYPSFAHPGEPNEELPYRQRILKRTLYSALYLDLREDEASISTDVVGMTAAAIAMLFAVIAAGLAQSIWNTFSLPFVLVMVVSYMIKDRIKERARRYLGQRFFARWLSDTHTRILNSLGSVIGHCRESVRIVKPAGVPRAILDVRHPTQSVIAESGRPEWVIHYVKDVTLHSDRMREDLSGLAGLNDIVRINLHRLRARMDSPSENYVLVHPQTRSLLTVPCAHVYHVHLVLRTTAMSKESPHSEIDHFRVVMDQTGIRRIERVQGRGEAIREGMGD